MKKKCLIIIPIILAIIVLVLILNNQISKQENNVNINKESNNTNINKEANNTNINKDNTLTYTIRIHTDDPQIVSDTEITSYTYQTCKVDLEDGKIIILENCVKNGKTKYENKEVLSKKLDKEEKEEAENFINTIIGNSISPEEVSTSDKYDYTATYYYILKDNNGKEYKIEEKGKIETLEKIMGGKLENDLL